MRSYVHYPTKRPYLLLYTNLRDHIFKLTKLRDYLHLTKSSDRAWFTQQRDRTTCTNLSDPHGHLPNYESQIFDQTKRLSTLYQTMRSYLIYHKQRNHPYLPSEEITHTLPT